MIENNNRDLNCSRRSVIVSNPTRGIRASARIRKQRIVETREYSEEDEDVVDPFADNSDVDSNYSERNTRNTNNKRLGNRRTNGNSTGRHSSEEKVKCEEVHSEVSSYRITRSGRIRRVVVTHFSSTLKKRRKKRLSVSRGIELSNGVVAAPVPAPTPPPTIVNIKPTSIQSLNKNGLTRGRDCTRVETASHWFSLDRQFKVGKFLMYKRDKPLLNTTNLSVWRIDSKSMLQKFEAFRDDTNDNELSKGTIKFKAVKVYGGWSPLHTEDYALVPVKVTVDNTKEDTITGEYIIQIDTSIDIDIDSDE